MKIHKLFANIVFKNKTHIFLYKRKDEANYFRFPYDCCFAVSSLIYDLKFFPLKKKLNLSFFLDGLDITAAVLVKIREELQKRTTFF